MGLALLDPPNSFAQGNPTDPAANSGLVILAIGDYIGPRKSNAEALAIVMIL